MACNGLTTVNVEITSQCNKDCWMCGRRKRDRLQKDLKYGDMDFDVLERIAADVPSGTVIQLHNNGEPLLYPRFGEAVRLFGRKQCITNIVTNGKLLLEKAEQIIGNLDTLSISIFEKDPEVDTQYEIIKRFLKIKGDQKPFTNLRLIGRVERERYEDMGQLIITRLLHDPEGSFNYKRGSPTIPEIGICLDLMNHLAIDRYGNVSVCVRFDPDGDLVLGNIKNSSLEALWQSHTRVTIKRMHIEGKRSQVPFCNKCSFWGVPTGE